MPQTLPGQHVLSQAPINYDVNSVNLDKGVEHTRERLTRFEEDHHTHLPQRHIAGLPQVVSNLKIYVIASYYAAKFIFYVEELRQDPSTLLPMAPRNIEKSVLMKDLKVWSSWDTLQCLTNQQSIRSKLTEVMRFMRTISERTEKASGSRRRWIDEWLDVYMKAIRWDVQDFERILLQFIQELDESFSETLLMLLPQSAITNLMNVLQSVIDLNTPPNRCIEQFLMDVVKHTTCLPRYLFLNDIKRVGSNPVGGGGFSDVWRGDFYGEIVALKVLRAYIDDNCPTAIGQVHKEFCKEAMIWRQLRHPNLLPFYGVLEDEFHPLLALVAPWMSNGHMIGYLKRNPDSDRMHLISGIANGLCYLHSLRPCVVHGDLRGANVLIDEQGQARIADFGLARIVDSQASTAGRTSLKGRGSIRWQAPELLDPKYFQGELCRTTKETDVYAFASVCLEVFTDNIPLPHLRDGQVIMEVVMKKKHPPRPPEPAASLGLDDRVWLLMTDCWSYEAGDRPSMQGVIRCIEGMRLKTGRVEVQGDESLFLRRVDVLSISLDNSIDDRNISSSPPVGPPSSLVHVQKQSLGVPRYPSPSLSLLGGARVPLGLTTNLPKADTSVSSQPSSSDNSLEVQAISHRESSQLSISYLNDINKSDLNDTPVGMNGLLQLPSRAGHPFDHYSMSLEDPTWRVLLTALKKHNMDDDAWQNYVLFIWYGKTERCLSYDEKPHLIFQRLKEAKKNPMFMLKHVKDVRSPIAIAKERQASLLGDSPYRHSRRDTVLMRSVPKSPLRAVTHRDQDDHNKTSSRDHPRLGGGLTADNLTASSEASYAIAIYPYMTEQPDEINVFMGDSFLILDRTPRRWFVQHDHSGSGALDESPPYQGWVPRGCFLETRITATVAFAQAKSAEPIETRDRLVSFWQEMPSSAPIFPSSIKSSRTAGLALMDYAKKGSEEVDLRKNDRVSVYKRYKHWTYVVRDKNGHRGWIPAWIIGRPTTELQMEPSLTILAPADAVKPTLMLDTSGLPSVNDIWSAHDSAQAEEGPFAIRSPASRGLTLPTPPPDPLLSRVLGDFSLGDQSGGSGWPPDERDEQGELERSKSGKSRQSEPILSNSPSSSVVRQQSKRYGRIWDFGRRTTVL